MRIGLNSFLYASPFTTKSTSLFAKFKKWGFATVEIPVEDPSHIDPVAVRAAAEKAGLAIGSICACMGPGRDFRGSEADQKAAMDYCVALIDQAAAMGCPRLIGPVYSVVGKADAVEPAQQKIEWALVVKNLKVLAKHAEAQGVTICIEPPPTNFLNLTSEKSGSIPVVSQSIIKPIVPVGARTEACALRQPFFSPIVKHFSHSLLASLQTSRSSVVAGLAAVEAAWCFRITRVCGSAFRA